MMNKAFRFRLYPTSEQQVLMAKTFGCVRFIYNQMLGDKIRHYNATGKKLNNTPAQYKGKFEWLREVDSMALCNAQLQLQTAYNNFFRSPKVGFPKYKSKRDNHKSYTTNCINGNIKIQGGYLVMPKLKGVRMKQHRQVPEHYVLKSVTVSRSPAGKYYASILYEYDEVIVPVEPKTFLGLDFAMAELYVDSDGTSACYPRFYRQTQDKMAREQRKLSRMTKGSKNREKQKLVVARLHEKVANQRSDFLHKVSRQITNAYDCVCVEDLDMKAMSQALNFGKSVSDNGWGMFTTFLRYKLEEEGKSLIKVDKWFPSSKMCSCCGSVKKSLPLSERVYACPHCGLVIGRDHNAAQNILEEGMRLAIAG